MGTKEDQIMDAKTEKAAKDVKKRETEENKGFREKLIKKITSPMSTLGKVNKVNKAINKVPTPQKTKGESRIGIDYLGRYKKRNKYKDKEINSANDYVKEDLKKKKMNEGGAIKKGYHKMPDGTVMKDSAHKMKHGGMVGKCKRDGIAVRGKTRAGR